MLQVQNKINRVILVHLELTKLEDCANDLDEFKLLANAAGAKIVSIITGKRETPDAKFFIGSGKAAEIREEVQLKNADLVIFNHTLTPAQERNLEGIIQCRVLDRTGLILDIFACRARSFEGKLQIELARLQRLSTRLIRGWMHLERQRGGIGLRGGPGETQLESDRRVIRKKVDTLKKRLEKVRAQREQSRRSRKRSLTPLVAIVGYTNTGKSTLFNRLTKANVYAADKLFATLDPTLRRIYLNGFGMAILADTVGFVRNLPHELVEAFYATLEETREADLLLHVVDASDDEHLAKITAVNAVLEKINANKVPQLLVYNKIDLLPNSEPRVDFDSKQLPHRVWISATNNQGIDLLLAALANILSFKATTPGL
ncbi:MAG: GTPase HflX [Gammaproteobacteria bacterium]|nr:GTPase HflX [Gammaproteobacteria bacterium]